MDKNDDVGVSLQLEETEIYIGFGVIENCFDSSDCVQTGHTSWFHSTNFENVGEMKLDEENRKIVEKWAKTKKK